MKLIHVTEVCILHITITMFQQTFLKLYRITRCNKIHICVKRENNIERKGFILVGVEGI